MGAWQSRITGEGQEAPDQLLANPHNWRIHPKQQQQALGAVLDSVGWVQRVIVNQRTGFVVDGHLRVALAMSRGEPTVPVVYVDLSPEEEALVLATFDPLAGMAVTDDAMLKELTRDMQVDDAELATLLGLGGTEARGDPDEVPEPPADPITKPGDLWLLGEHQLLCGDSTDPEALGRLLGPRAADVLLTDPPYGLDRNLSRSPKREWRIVNDNPVDASRMYAALRALNTVPERYVWGQWNTWATLTGALGEPDNCIVWVKSQMGMGHGYRHRHEFCAYYGDKTFSDQSDVWEASRDHSGLHPTIKPVELFERAIVNSSEAGALVLDPFLGSGTSLIAAERTGRVCYGIEIDPAYCDVIVKRWEAFTGQEAVLDEDSITDEVIDAFVESH